MNKKENNSQTLPHNLATINPNFLIKTLIQKFVYTLSGNKFLRTDYRGFNYFLENLIPVTISSLTSRKQQSFQIQNQEFFSNIREFIFLNQNLARELDSAIIQNYVIANTNNPQNVQQPFTKNNVLADFSINKPYDIANFPFTVEMREKNRSKLPTDINIEKQNMVSFVENGQQDNSKLQNKEQVVQEENTNTDHVVSIDPMIIMKYLPLSLSLPDTIYLHTGSRANKITQSYKADAVTLENEIFLAKDKLNLSTPQGIALLIHELTHVDQNEKSSNQYNISFNNSNLEEQAINNEKQILSFFEHGRNNQQLTDSDYGSTVLNSNNSIMTANHEKSFYTSTSNFMQTNLQPNSLLDFGLTILGNNPNLFFSDNYFVHDSSAMGQEHTFLSDVNKSNLVYVEHTVTRSEKNVIPTNVDTAKNSNTQSFPMAARSDRTVSVNPTASHPVLSQPTASINVDMIANQVYEKISQKIKLERDRIGYR